MGKIRPGQRAGRAAIGVGCCLILSSCLNRDETPALPLSNALSRVTQAAFDDRPVVLSFTMPARLAAAAAADPGSWSDAVLLTGVPTGLAAAVATGTATSQLDIQGSSALLSSYYGGQNVADVTARLEAAGWVDPDPGSTNRTIDLIAPDRAGVAGFGAARLGGTDVHLARGAEQLVWMRSPEAKVAGRPGYPAVVACLGDVLQARLVEGVGGQDGLLVGTGARLTGDGPVSVACEYDATAADTVRRERAVLADLASDPTAGTAFTVGTMVRIDENVLQISGPLPAGASALTISDQISTLTLPGLQRPG